MATAYEPLMLIKAQHHAQRVGCPRCAAGIFMEQLFHESMTMHQFRCVICGWRDDVRYMDTLTDREFERQERRAATEEAKGFAGKITED
jgi:hypothetical protein